MDAGLSSIKGIHLRRNGDKIEVVRAESETLPAGAADPVARAQAAQRVAQELGFPDVPLVAVLGGPGTILRRVAFPKMNPSELQSALSFEAEKYIPFKLDEVFFDFSILNDKGNGQMEVLLAAARRELVNEQIELLAPCGVPLAIDLETAALANAWEASPAAGEANVTGLLHIGERGTVLDFIHQSQLEFAREIPLQPTERPSWEEWFGQCRASFDFYEDQFGRHVEKLALNGGGARIPGLREWIQETSGLPAEMWDPFEGFPGGNIAGTEGSKGEFTVVFGSALRGLHG